MITRCIDYLASKPKVFNILRAILEYNFPAEKRAIKKYLNLAEGDKIIDIGCGTGEFARFFNTKQYIGIDTESKYIEDAKKKYKGRFLVGDGRHLSFVDNTFSHALIIGVIHHLSDEVAETFLEEAKRVVKKDGYLLIMEDVVSSRDGWLTKKIHQLDKGSNIRSAEGYQNLLLNYFEIKEAYRGVSGVCPYQIFWLKNSK